MKSITLNNEPAVLVSENSEIQIIVQEDSWGWYYDSMRMGPAKEKVVNRFGYSSEVSVGQAVIYDLPVYVDENTGNAISNVSLEELKRQLEEKKTTTTITAQAIYDWREEEAVVDGIFMHNMFRKLLGEPSPSGYRSIDVKTLRDAYPLHVDGILEYASSAI